MSLQDGIQSGFGEDVSAFHRRRGASSTTPAVVPRRRMLLADASDHLPIEATEANIEKPMDSKAILVHIDNVVDIESSNDAIINPRRAVVVSPGEVLTPIEPDMETKKRRSLMVRILSETKLAKILFDAMVDTQKRREEWGGWILEDGRVANFSKGGRDRKGFVTMMQAEPVGQGEVEGYFHTHPTRMSELAPPGSDDFDKEVSTYPVNLVVESASGRLWGQAPPKLCMLLGRIAPSGKFQPLAKLDPLANTVFRVQSHEAWKLDRLMNPKRN